MRHLLFQPLRLLIAALVLSSIAVGTLYADGPAAKPKLQPGTDALPGTVKPLDENKPKPEAEPDAEPKPITKPNLSEPEVFLNLPSDLKKTDPKTAPKPTNKPLETPKITPEPKPATPKPVIKPGAVLTTEAIEQFTAQLNKLQARIDALTLALTDSRISARKTKVELERQTILNRLQKKTLDELAASGKPAGPADPASARALQNRIETLEMQLRLATIKNDNERTAAIVAKLKEIAGVCRDQKAQLAAQAADLATAKTITAAYQNQVTAIRQQHQIDLARQAQASVTTKIALQKSRVDLATALGRAETLERKLRIAEAPRATAADPALLASLRRQLASSQAEAKLATSRASSAEASAKKLATDLAASNAKNLALQGALVAAVTKPPTAPVSPVGPAVTKPVTPATPSQPTKAVTGKITDLSENMVILNIGRSNGLRRGMRLVVYRDTTFVGYVQIDKVTDSEAYGTLSRQVVPARIGDLVVDESTVDNAGQ